MVPAANPKLRWSGKTGHKMGVTYIVTDVQNPEKIELSL
jgi:uncharacterized protein YndB with AHSA1/START domain